MAHVAPISVVIADDHPIVRAGIVGMLGKAADVRVVAETGDGARVERLAVEHAPNVLVLDVNMPGLDPINVTRRLKETWPLIHVLVLSAFADESYVTGLLSAGAVGYVLKDEALDSLVTAIRAVAAGESWLSQRIAAQLARKAITPPPPDRAATLTDREREVLRQLALGFSNDDIAERLFISKRTVQNHVSNVYAKLGLESRAEAVLFAIRQGIVCVEEVKDL